MDPLSVTASIIGILGAASKISSVLFTFIQNTAGAPKLAQAVLSEVNSLSAVLGQLQGYLLGVANSSKSRASLILVEQVIVTLAECVTTFSELEDVLGTARVDSDLGVLDRMKWAMKESKVTDIQGRLQNNKASLTLMLTILQCKSMEEAELSMTRLCNLVEQVLAKNQEMSLRLRNIDDAVTGQAGLGQSRETRSASNTSSRTATPPPGPKDDHFGDAQRKPFGFTFEEDLLASRVYQKPLFSNSGESLVTSAARTTASSILSSLSLTDVSNISILAVPIYAHEISNSARYTFGDFQPEAFQTNQQLTPEPAQQTGKTKKWSAFANAVRYGKLSKGAKTNTTPESELRVLGVPLSESILHANVAISLTKKNGEKYVYGYIPIFVAKPGVFLKEAATETRNIFSISGSPLRLQALETIFNSPPRYGKGVDWSGYTPHDVASIFLRFLLRLPEPVIPTDQYEAFHGPLGTPRGEHDYTVRAFQELFTLLPNLSRQLLLYLLDIFAVFASKSDINKMTVRRLAAIFQPAILSPIKAGDDFIEDVAFRRNSQDVVVFLIENQEHFLDRVE